MNVDNSVDFNALPDMSNVNPMSDRGMVLISR